MQPFPAFNSLKTCRYGQVLFNQHDQYIGRSLDLYAEFSEGEVEVFRQIIRPGDAVIDVGANIGAHTLCFAQQCGPTGCVVAFEPQRICFQALCANMAINNVTNALCLPYAVGSVIGEISVPTLNVHADTNFGGLSLGGAVIGERVRVITLDTLNLQACRLVKIDVEGMEQDVLRGAVALIGKYKPVLYVENDRPDKAAALIRFIDSLGYVMYWHCPPLFNPRNFAKNPVNVFGNVVSRNMICFHRSQPTQISGSIAVEVPGSAD